MNTLTTEPTTTTSPRTFIAKCHNLVLVIEPARDLRDENGRRYGTQPPVAVEFTDHLFTADEKSAAALGMSLGELIEWLHAHEMFNSAVWDEAAPPDAVSPTIKEVSADIFAAVERQDPDAIAKIIERERGTHGRGSVLQTAQAALEQIAGVPAEE